MKALLLFATVGIVALTANGDTQDSKKQPGKVVITKAMFWVPNQHCPECAPALAGSLKIVKGIKSATVNFPNKSATVEFDENVISVQEVVRAMFEAPHMMGKDMQYSAMLLLTVPGVNKDKTSQTKATDVLSKVEGVAKVTFYPKQQAVGILFADKGKATSKQLIDELGKAGWKGVQYIDKAKK